MQYTTAIVAAAGKGKRMKSSIPKAFLNLCGKPLLLYSLDVFEKSNYVDKVVISVPEGMVKEARRLIERCGYKKVKEIVCGASTRAGSVYNALLRLKEEDHFILVHDAARPFVNGHLVKNTVIAAKRYGGCIAAIPVKDTIKEVDLKTNNVIKTPERKSLYEAQTPQVFKRAILLDAYKKLGKRAYRFTDEASLVEASCKNVNAASARRNRIKIVMGDYSNIKITTRKDLDAAKLPPGTAGARIGFGYDIHRLVKNRRLVIGGVNIPFQMGLTGHSDADVLTHAICDALLGAAGCGDIGEHFPDTDARFRNISSLKLLDKVVKIIGKKDLFVDNIDATVLADKPRISVFKKKMEKSIATVARINPEDVNIKATTEEGTRRQKAISAYAVALLKTRDSDHV